MKVNNHCFKYLLLFVVLTLFMVSGHSFAEDKTIVVLQGVDAVTLNPHHTSSMSDMSILLSILDTLLTKDEDGTLKPWVATDWKALDDTTWEFKIREGIKDHQGNKIDATDVAYSFNRVLDPDTEPRGHLLWIAGNIDLKKAEAIDNQTVHVYTNGPSPILPEFMWQWYVLPKDYYENTPLEELSRKPMGTGPFVFVEWRRGDRIVVEANKNYWAGPSEVESVIWKAVPESSARIAELNTGNADIIVNVPPDQMHIVDSSMGRVETVPGYRRMYLGFTFYQDESIQDVRVRQALNYAIDFQRIIEYLLEGRGERVGSWASPPFICEDVKPYPYDPEKARELLTAAGYEDRTGDGYVENPDGSRLELTLQTSVGRYVKELELAQAIVADMRRTGVYVEVMPMEWSTYSQQLSTKSLTGEMWLLGAGAGYGVQADLSDFYTGTAWGPGDWANDEFDALFEELMVTFEQEERDRISSELQQLMFDKAPLVFLYNQVDYYGVSNRIDWSPSPDERIRIYNMTTFLEN